MGGDEEVGEPQEGGKSGRARAGGETKGVRPNDSGLGAADSQTPRPVKHPTACPRCLECLERIDRWKVEGSECCPCPGSGRGKVPPHCGGEGLGPKPEGRSRVSGLAGF